MNPQISSDSQQIQYVYDWYLNDILIVNRKYQRKLVWTYEEKRAFIDSLIKQYSVPLFLFAKSQADNTKFEIIDGMQRLNAIFNFIENEFPVAINGKEYYFDLDADAGTKQLKDEGKITQKEPILDRQYSIAFMKYPLPLSYLEAEEKDVENVFRRINSFGKKLSNQEIRQAGAVGQFPDLVRIIASELRGDIFSKDIVPLQLMKQISLSNRHLESYGININDTFWVRHEIITYDNMRISRDEELIAYILTYILLGKKADVNRFVLDMLYTNDELSPNNNIHFSAEDAIRRLTVDRLRRNFINVSSFIDSVLTKNNVTFAKCLYANKSPHALFRTYQVVFLAFYEILINDGKMINDEEGLFRKLKNLGELHLNNIDSDSWDAQFRSDSVSAVKSLLLPYFVDSVGYDVASNHCVLIIDNLIRRYSIETGQHDYKIGIHSLHDGSDFDRNLAEYVKTLIASVNRGAKTKGYIIIGVAESEQSANKVIARYGSAPANLINGTKFYITGVEGEIKQYHHDNIDSYMQKIRAVILNLPITDEVKLYITTHISLVSYYEHNVLLLELKSCDAPIPYDDKFYVREHSETIEIKGAQAVLALTKNFAH